METLAIWDYVILGVYMGGVLLLGILFSGHQTSTREYFLAGCNVPWWAVSISMYATALSPITFLGVTGWIFLKDSRYALGSLYAVPMVILQIVIWIPIWSRLRFQSIFQYLEQRFHPGVRSAGAVIFLIQMIFWIGTGTVAASKAFEAAMGIDPLICLFGLILLGTLYTVLGGSKAVIWTDVAQYVVFVFAFVVIGYLLLSSYDWQAMEIYHAASSLISQETGYRHTQLFSFEFSFAIEATIWAILFVRLIDMCTWGTHQVSVQRLMAVDTHRNMIKAIVGTAVIGVVFMVVYMFISWGFVAFYHDHLDLKQTLDHPDQIMADYTVRFVPTIARGLIMAGLLAAIMSSFDSALNSMSSVMINDFYRRYWRLQHDEKHYVHVARIFTLIFGITMLLFSLWQLSNLEFTVVERLGKLSNLVLGTIPCFFLLGIFSRRVTTGGALIGGIASTIFAILFNGIPGFFGPVVEGMNWMWIGGLSLLVGLVIGYAASFLFSPKSSEALIGLTVIKASAN